MEPTHTMACGGKDTATSLQLTYKTVQQIAQSLWIAEKDEELKTFHASLMAYCTIIQDHLNRISNAASVVMDGNLIALLLAPNKPISTASFCGRSIAARLRELSRIRDQIQRTGDNTANLNVFQSCLDFGSTPELRKEFVKSLATCEEELRTRYPEDPPQWAPDDLAPRINIGEPSFAVWSAAQSTFKALVACVNCPCTPTHDFGARLCLGTYRKPELESDVDKDDGVDFDMFLSMRQDWHEVRIHTAKERLVQIVVDQAEVSQPKTRRPITMKVNQLCKPIAKSMAAYRLEFKVARGQLFKLRSERSNSSVDKSRSAVSLDEFLRDRTGSFTERTKRILAVILSSAVFHLHNTPWLQPTWNSSDVLFFRTASSTVPLRPFIQTPLDTGHQPSLDQDNTGQDDIDPDDIDPDDLLSHQCPTLVTLAMMLLEVYFVTPFNVLAQRYNVDLGSGTESSPFARYMDVNVVFQACRKEIPDNSQFYWAVENCLDPKVWEDEEGNRLDDPTLRTKIYQEVVLPLETELSQAYSSIPIDDLDRFVQKVDFAGWGPTMHMWHQQTNAEGSRANSLVPLTPYYPRCSPTPQLCRQYSEDVFREGGAERGTQSITRRPSPLLTGFEAEPALEHSDSFDVETHSPWAYTVGILCALPKELLAVRALFDSKHSDPKHLRGDSNSYALGTMNDHMVVAACLPSGEYGTNAAADSASNMKRSFPSIRFCFLVGIGGGAPTEVNDIRLGDVVVSVPKTTFPGVIQYDRGKQSEGSTFELTGALQPPPRYLMTAISSLRSNPDLPSNALEPYLEDIVRRVPASFKAQYGHPGQENDHLFKLACSACLAHGECAAGDSHIQRRPCRPTNHPEVHYGLIASGNRVLKDAKVRDQWARKYGILCFEMEAAGVMNTFPCLVIRGICDYADSYKNDQWQNYAAATAAATTTPSATTTPTTTPSGTPTTTPSGTPTTTPAGTPTTTPAGTPTTTPSITSTPTGTPTSSFTTTSSTFVPADLFPCTEDSDCIGVRICDFVRCGCLNLMCTPITSTSTSTSSTTTATTTTPMQTPIDTPINTPTPIWTPIRPPVWTPIVKFEK
ncbi:hypothetical protein B0T10DRAFT_609949 [Thelonectria olida]|uniref:Nucleoside phosphorylase domain-containing protein n=1 Tax=Thelonectria olida TaxID=1576542 RepID=A0A9P8VVH0_9HYPO|nr:hypothetical protein B0T10DRAFT_609949 [Thelonectria olida]